MDLAAKAETEARVLCVTTMRLQFALGRVELVRCAGVLSDS
jgi:hypothetical protein